MDINIERIKDYAHTCYKNNNCKYDNDKEYYVHTDMVGDVVENHKSVFKINKDYENTLGAAACHDLLEDTKESYNDISKITGGDIADITLAVTDVLANNRLMKHLLTMGKTVKDYRAIILKMSDIYANASYSKTHSKSMYKKYVTEYAYRKPIFQLALSWYKEFLNQDELDRFWKELDEIHATN